jgi:hypothetical protein
MERERIRGSHTQQLNFMPSHLLRRRHNSHRRCRQRRHMQRLANVARGPIRAASAPIRVMVKECTARREVQQRQAAKYRQRPRPYVSLGNSTHLQVRTPLEFGVRS